MTRFLAMCGVCRSRLVAIVAVAVGLHWIMELVAVAAIAQFACQ